MIARAIKGVILVDLDHSMLVYQHLLREAAKVGKLLHWLSSREVESRCRAGRSCPGAVGTQNRLTSQTELTLPAELREESNDVVTRPDVGNVLTHDFHHARRLVSEKCWNAGQLSINEMQVAVTQSRADSPYKHLPCGRFVDQNRGDVQHSRLVRQDRSFHVHFPLPDCFALLTAASLVQSLLSPTLP